MNIKKYWKVLCVFVSLIVAIACVALIYRKPAPTEDGFVRPGNSFRISNSELQDTIRRSNAGEIPSMRRLFGYYAIYKRDSEKAEYWRWKLANAGDREFQEGILEELDDSSSDADKTKAQELSKKWGVQIPKG